MSNPNCIREEITIRMNSGNACSNSVWNLLSSKDTQINITLNSARQHNQFITQCNYKATCFDYRLVILRSILSVVSQDAMHNLGYIYIYTYIHTHNYNFPCCFVWV
jgi:hypothetical protein